MESDRHVPDAVAAAVGELATRLRQRYGDDVLAVRLFGSYARGEADELSDVDVAVVLERVDRDTWDRWLAQERALVLDILDEGVPA